MTHSTQPLAVALLLAAASGSALCAGEPTQLAVQSYPSATSAWISWSSDAPVATTQFRVDRRTLGNPNWFPVSGNLPGSTRGFGQGPQSLQTSSAYEFRVVALPASGPALISPTPVVLYTPSAAATQADFDAAAAPRRVDAQAVSPTEVIVTWTDQTPDETHFKVERRQGNGIWSAVATLPADTALYKDTGLSPASSYEYRVVAERNGQQSATSAGRLAATPGTGSANTLRYVDGSACNTGNNSGTQTDPWKTIQTAATSMRAGLTLLVRNRADCATPTVYKTTPNAAGKHSFAIVDISNDANSSQFATGGSRSGTPTAWITYRNYPGERPKLRTARGGLTSGGFSTSDSGNFVGISVRNVSYVVIDGFEVEGHLNDVTLAEATALNAKFKADFLNPPVPPAVKTPITPVVDANGIAVGTGVTSAQMNQIPHHIVVRNNLVYNMPGYAIGGQHADWLTFENNRARNSAWYTPYGSSPMGVLMAKDVDTNTSAYKIIFRGNQISDSGNLFPCNCYSYIQPTDGNGLILDLFRSTEGGLPAYAGRSLITNNLIHNNGGRGIHIFKSQNADIVFNTLVRNNTIAITGDGELSSQLSRNVRAYNNIVVARTDRPTHVISFVNAAAKLADGASIDFNHNIIFGGNPAAPQIAITATQGGLRTNNRLNLDPGFSTNSGTGAFRLRANSPAVNSAWSGVTPPTRDFFSAPRPRGSAADVGAVESF